jgi:hypothetical protein
MDCHQLIIAEGRNNRNRQHVPDADLMMMPAAIRSRTVLDQI